MQRTLIIFIFLCGIISCKSSLIIHDIKTENISNSENLTLVDSSVIKLVEPYKNKLTSEMQEVIGFSTVELIKERPESKLTNYIGDLFLEEGRLYATTLPSRPIPVIAYLNYGGLRSALPQGDITVGKIYELMPFENEMVLLKLKGDDVYAFAEKIAIQGGDCVSGIRLHIRNGKVSHLTVNGKPFDRSAEYWMVTNDYVANGGDEMQMFTNRLQYIATGIKLRDCMISHMKREHQAGKKISPQLDGRIYAE
ncbi:MAG: 5'-nucleotidase C-terminal domain-containing protein [Mangrovibacterium sp.]